MSDTTVSEMWHMTKTRWRERNYRGVYFWASWIAFRLHLMPALILTGGVAALCVLLGVVS